MTSEVTITLKGDKIPTFKAIGASINYGINRIPTASVQLDPAANDLLCDFDSIRRSNATLSVETTNGCLYFDGVVDGLTFAQSPGGLSTTMILKHPFQLLAEVYPRILGVHPGSIDIFHVKNTVNVDYNGVPQDALLKTLTIYGAGIDTKKNLVDYSIALAKAAVKTQEILPLTAAGVNTVGLHRVVAESDLIRKKLIVKVLALLDGIDTSATAGMIISAAGTAGVEKAIQAIAEMRDNVFATLVRELSQLGCALIIGSKKAYVVPEAAYLRIPKIGAADRAQRSELVNVIYPAEYNSFVFNDNGFVNLKGVYVLHSQTGTYTTATAGNHIDLGVFIDKAADGNIYTTTLPNFISHGILTSAVIGAALQRKIKGGTPLVTKKVEASTLAKVVKDSFDAVLDTSARNLFLNQWAEMEYCRMKYDDRTGSISSLFNNNWAPGLVGTLYTREPGTWLDYFVVDVTHSFSLSPPSGGQALTSVQFKCGRMGATSNVGLDNLALYDFTYDKALTYGGKFLDDIST